MIILEDSRQQEGKHKLKQKWFEDNGIQVHRTKLFVGDYTLPTNQTVCVDTKKDIQELIGDIVGKQHERFRVECIRAQECGIKLIILVENEPGYADYGKKIYNKQVSDLKDLASWVNPRLCIFKSTNEIEGYYKNGKPKYKRKQAYPNATKGVTLMKACYTMAKRYGVEFQFCHPDEAGQRVIELLRG